MDFDLAKLAPRVPSGRSYSWHTPGPIDGRLSLGLIEMVVFVVVSSVLKQYIKTAKI
jgi:hypothetical protein